jgi:hypothetical protein
MSASKVIENVVIFGGIGAMAYLLLKKKPVVIQKPIVTTTITEKGKGAVNEIDWTKGQRKLCADFIMNKSGVASTGVSFANYRSCNDIQEKNELNEHLIDLNVLSNKIDYNKLKSEQWNALYLDYFTQDGELKANTCLELDWLIKNFGLAEVQSSAGSVGIKQQISKMAREKFERFNCRDKIEAVRTRNLIDLQSQGSIKAEESIVGKGFAEQKTYIILGALVLLTGFYIVVKK